MVDALDHTVGNLLTDLNTGIVGGLLLVVTSVGTLVQTLDEIIHIGSIHVEATYQIILQTLSLSHTDGVTHGVNIILQTRSGSRVAA